MSASRSRRVVSVLFFLALCASGPIICAWLVAGWGDRLSYVDQYSEANVLREVRHFLEDGLARHYGLGTVYYPGMYPEDGFAVEKNVSMYGVSSEGVYTHYPPGPEYLAYAAARVFGPTPVSHLRLVPITIGWVAMTCLGLSVRRRFGTAVGWLVMGACAVTPTVWDGFVGLHAQGYAGALLMIELALAIGRGAGLWPFALLGFLQGWLTFDYFFFGRVDSACCRTGDAADRPGLSAALETCLNANLAGQRRLRGRALVSLCGSMGILGILRGRSE